MSNLSGFNAHEVPASTYGAMPPGLYAVMATASERKSTKAGTGEYLQFTVDVLEEKYNNKKLWVRLNLWNSNPTAVSIAKEELAAFCLAVGIPAPEDSSELLNIPFVVQLGVESDGRGGEQNKIKKYYSVAAANELGDKPVAQVAKPTPAPVAATGKPVWPQAR